MSEIKEIVKKNINEVSKVNIDSFDGLCKYFANNISADLEDIGLIAEAIDIRNYVSVDYEHIFLIVPNFFTGFNFYLIDPTYRQFSKEKGKNILFFDKWPGDILKSNNPELLDNLLNQGFSKVSEKDVNDYLSSFGKTKEFSFEKLNVFSLDGGFNDVNKRTI